MTTIKRKNYLVVGLGKTGIACVDHLLRSEPTLWVTDVAGLPPELNSKAITFLTTDACVEALAMIDEIIVSPGVDLQKPLLVRARERNIPIIGDVECFARVAQAPVIAVTGTNGKGTVVSLIAHILRHCGYQVGVGGNIGTPVLTLLEQPAPDVYVLELSSFQLESTFSLQPKVATVLNVTPDHLDRHGSMEAYIQAKQRIYHQATFAVVNGYDPLTLPPADFSGEIVACALETQAQGFGTEDAYITYNRQKRLSVEALKIKGHHNLLNVIMALTIGDLFNAPIEAMINALPTFTGLRHRCEWVGRRKGVDWLNDSKATNIGAAMAALQGVGESIRGKILWIAGGQGKGVDFSPLRQPVQAYVSHGILLGEDGALLYNALQGTVPLTLVPSLHAAMEVAQGLAQPGDVVLLSPACASFDMFRHYEDRGEVFAQWVRAQEKLG